MTKYIAQYGGFIQAVRRTYDGMVGIQSEIIPGAFTRIRDQRHEFGSRSDSCAIAIARRELKKRFPDETRVRLTKLFKLVVVPLR